MFRLDENWEIFHVIKAILTLTLGVGGSVLLADKKHEDENLKHEEKQIEESIKKIKAIQKDEYMLYDDEDEEEHKKSAKREEPVKTGPKCKHL